MGADRINDGSQQLGDNYRDGDSLESAVDLSSLSSASQLSHQNLRLPDVAPGFDQAQTSQNSSGSTAGAQPSTTQGGLTTPPHALYSTGTPEGVSGTSGYPGSISTTQLQDSEALWRDLSQSAAEGRKLQWQENNAQRIIKAFADVYKTELAVPEILPYWLGDPMHLTRDVTESDLSELMELWSCSKRLAEETPVSLDPTLRLTRRLNSAASENMHRLVEMYHMIRLEKILEDPQGLLEIEEANPGKKVFRAGEVELARQLAAYAEERDWDLPEVLPSFVHVRSRDPKLPLSFMIEILRACTEDAMIDLIAAELQKNLKSGTDEGDRLPSSGRTGMPSLESFPAGRTFIFYSSDVFRLGLIKGRLSGRQ